MSGTLRPAERRTLAPEAVVVLAALRDTVAASAHFRLDSRSVGRGDVFLACPGEVVDGRDYIEAAVAAGAAAVLYEAAQAPAELAAHLQRQGVAGFALAGLHAQAADLAAAWYGHPAEALTVIAVTGTNGKTSCTQWLAQALTRAGQPCGVIGTLGTSHPDGHHEATDLTTPDGVTLQRVLAEMRRRGARAVAIEASSIGIAQGRLDAIPVHIAAFTNLSRDHLDYHADMANYAAAKRRLFAWPGLRALVINADDAKGAEWLPELDPSRVLAYAHRQAAATSLAPRWLRAERVAFGEAGLSCELVITNPDASAGEPTATGSDRRVALEVPVLGLYNLENLLLVAGVLSQMGLSLAAIATALSTLEPVPGRLQRVIGPEGRRQPLVVVDYAHTPEALERVLQTLRPLAEAGGGRLVCVFGCGGNRDAGKRPQMGAVAARLADQVWATSDNPRQEDPREILRQIAAGRPDHGGAQWQVEPERARAILRAVGGAAEGDVVLIAGKGHEATQEQAGRKIVFHDAEWARLALWLPVCGAVRIDTRQLQAGDVFVALRGERFDGHEFVDTAFAGGARLAVVSRADEAGAAAGPCVLVNDGLEALAHLAASRRAEASIPVIAVTGSNGKTTTKEMLAAILRAWLGDDAVLATQGNLNNHIGVPLTLLRLRPEHRAAVIELGMNHPGEIAALAELAGPTVALVNNAQREHQEFMHSVAAVARENGAVFASLPIDGVAVFPHDDEHVAVWRTLADGRRTVTFGSGEGAELRALDVQLGTDGSRCEIVAAGARQVLRLPIPGLHNVHNALAAAACALAAGCPLPAVAAGLAAFQAVAGRLQAVDLPGDIQAIDDTYNANPDSVRAAIDVLAAMPAPRVLVLGDMGEVGADGPQVHAEVGAYARERGIERLWALGEASRRAVEAFGDGAQHAATVADIVDGLRRQPPASVLFKGSRFMRMERVLAAYREALQGNGGNHHVA